MILSRNLTEAVRGANGKRAQPEGGLSGDKLAERFDPDGPKGPEGEWKLRRRRKRGMEAWQRVNCGEPYPAGDGRGGGAVSRTGQVEIRCEAKAAGRDRRPVNGGFESSSRWRREKGRREVSVPGRSGWQVRW